MSDPVKLFMSIIEILIYIIIIFSKLTSDNKIIFIIVILIFKILNFKLNTFLKFKFKVKIANPNLLDKKIKQGTSNIYSMPSGHAQYISFFICLIYLIYINSNRINTDSKYLYILLISSILIYIIVFLRCLIYNYHTSFEYITGSVLGSLVGFITYSFVNRLTI